MKKRHYNSPSVGASKNRRSDNIFGDAMPRQNVHIYHVVENVYPYMVVYLIKKANERKFLLEPCW